MKKVEVGQKLYEPVKKEIKEWGVTSIGRIYFEVNGHRNKKFSLETLKYTDKDYTQYTRQLYTSKEEIIETRRLNSTKEKVKQAFTSYNTPTLTAEEWYQIEKILYKE